MDFEPFNSAPIVLATASPVRQRLLAASGIKAEAVPARVDESAVRQALLADGDGIEPGDLAEVLARAKVDDVAGRTGTRHVIGADQVLFFDGQVFEKPDDFDAARANLLSLSGCTHALHSAVVLAEAGEVVWAHVERADVTLRELSPAFVGRYLARAGTSVLGSVGCYELEGLGAQLVARIDGDYFTVLGLPLLALLAELRRQGLIEA